MLENRTQEIKPIILIGKESTLNINEYGVYDKIQNTEDATVLQAEYLDIIEQNDLEIDGIEFQFTDMLWDFSENALEGKNKERYRYKFMKIKNTNDYFITISKLFVFSKLLENGIHMTVTIKKLEIINRFIIYLYKGSIYNIEDVSLQSIQAYFEDLDVNYRTLISYKSVIKEFLSYYSLMTQFRFDNAIFDYLEEVNKNKLKAICLQGKRKLLPQSFVKAFRNKLFDEIIGNERKYKIIERQCLCLLFICTQTGLRPSELTILKKDCLETKIIDGVEIHYLHYKSTKNVHGGGYTLGKTVANLKVVKIINELLKYPDNENNNLVDTKIDSKKLTKILKKFIKRNAEDLGVITYDKPDDTYEGLPIKLNINGKSAYVNVPLLVQFRVYFATELSQRGYSEMLIAKLLNHKDEKMFNYYARPVTSIQEDPNFSELVVKETLLKDYKILGPNGDVYKNKMLKFIEEKEVNTKKDIDDVINDVLKNIPIRKKLGGYCIKPNPLRACEHDAPTDEFYCAYDMCQNQCHFFYHCSYYLQQMREGQKLYEFNKNKGYKQQSQKELYKIQSIINSKILPELEELKNEIMKRGVEEIILEHNDLEEIINNLDNIMLEVKIWKEKTA